MSNAYERHDRSDESWEKMEFLLPGRTGSWGGNACDNRQFINAVFRIFRTGAPWRDCRRVMAIGRTLIVVLVVGAIEESGNPDWRN